MISDRLPESSPDRQSREQEEGLLPSFAASSPTALLSGRLPGPLATLLGDFFRRSRWFRGKARSINRIEILDQLVLSVSPVAVSLIVARVSYGAENPETYVFPLAFAADSAVEPVPVDRRLFGVVSGAGRVVAYDAAGDPALPRLLLELFVRARTAGERGAIRATPTEGLLVRVAAGQLPAGQVARGEQSNTTVFFGAEFMIKLFRQLEAGLNPDVEVNEFLWAHGYRQVPEPLGSAYYTHPDIQTTLGIAQRFVPNRGTAWDATLEALDRCFDRAHLPDVPRPEAWGSGDDLLDSAGAPIPDAARALVEPYAAFATRLGERTAELHLALASDATLPAFAPEPFTADYQRSIVVAAHDRLDRACALLTRQLDGLPEGVRPQAEAVFACRTALARGVDTIGTIPVHASRIRCHGDYHLGQVLSGDADLTILDFEGEPAQPLEIRRRKGSALYDVCGMLRSFHYAATVARLGDRWRQADPRALTGVGEAWSWWAGAMFLSAYLRRARQEGASPVFLPDSHAALRALLRLHLIDKCSYELSYELNNRPAWVGVPIAGLLSLARGL